MLILTWFVWQLQETSVPFDDDDRYFERHYMHVIFVRGGVETLYLFLASV